MIIFADVVATGRSIQETIPASVSKLSDPRFRLSIDVMPEYESYNRAPESISSPPTIVVVAFFPVDVSIRIIGVAVVDVAIVHENDALSFIVDVAFVA